MKLAAAAFCLFSSALQAQTPKATSPTGDRTSQRVQIITLSQAIGQALEKNYTVRTTQNDVERSRTEVTRAKDNLLPDATASSSYTYNYSLKPESSRAIRIDTSEFISAAG